MSTATLNIEKNKTLVPQLRFQEFDGEWEENELKNLTSKITVGIATEVRPYISEKIDVALLRNQNIKAGYFDNTNMEYIIPEFDESNKNKRVKSNDVIIVRTGSNMGKACVVPKEYENSQTFTTLIVRPLSTKLNSSFLSYHINYLGLSEIERLSAGGGKPNLNAGFLKHYRINVSELKEQQKIASFLSVVDEKIQQLSRKKELLAQYKKGVMQQLFSGKLRFKDENGKDYVDWEQKKLGEIAKITTGGTPNTFKKEYWGGSIRWMNSGELNLKIVNEVENRITEEGLNNSSTKMIPIKCILIGLAGQGKTRGTAAMNLVELCTNQSIASILPNYEKFIPEYLYQNIDQRYDELRGLSTGDGGRGGLNLQIIKSFKMKLPSLPEQQKIANFLSSIDTKIESTNQQITQTQSFKKGLLQKMFV